MGCAASMAASAGGPTSQPVLGGKDKSNPPGDTPRLEGGAAQSSDSQWGPAQAEAKAGSITESVWDLTEINRLSRGAWCGDDCDGTINNPIVACQAPTAPFDDKGALPQQLTGLALLSDPSCNRGGGFTGAERTLLGIRGLLPPAVQTLKRQEDLLMSLVRSAKTGIEKHRIMQAVKAENHTSFYRALAAYPSELLPVVWTPTIGTACLQHGWTVLSSVPKGLYITISDQGSVPAVVANWPHDTVKVVILTDGENVVGFGDLGSHAMPLAVSKCDLCTSCGGIPPSQCLAVCIDTGTDNPKLLRDGKYVGLRHQRVRGAAYDELLDEIMCSIARRWPDAIIMFEAFSALNSFRLLDRYRGDYRTFDDSIQSSAAVVLASLMSACRHKGTKLADEIILVCGAGNSGCGIASLVAKQIASEGVSEKDAASKIWMVDSWGIIVKSKSRENIPSHKIPFARESLPLGIGEDVETDLLGIVEAVRPTCIIGVSDQGGSFDRPVLEAMARINKHPVVFALSTPEENAECAAIDAYLHTKGKALFCSGSQSTSVIEGNTLLKASQAVNAYIFPGVVRGIVSANGRVISDDVMLASARALAQMVSDADLHQGSLLPPLPEMRKVAAWIGSSVATHVVKGVTDAAVWAGGDMDMVDVEPHMYRPAYNELFTAPTAPCQPMLGGQGDLWRRRKGSPTSAWGSVRPLGDGFNSTLPDISMRSSMWAAM